MQVHASSRTKVWNEAENRERDFPTDSVWEKKTDRFAVYFSFSQVAQLLKRREFLLVLKRGSRSWVQTEMVKFISLPFPSSKKLKIWSFHVVVVQERQGNLQKSVVHLQSCCFAVAITVEVLLGPQ